MSKITQLLLEGLGVKNLSIEQLHGVKTLFQAKLDTELMEQIKATNPNLLKEPKK